MVNHYLSLSIRHLFRQKVYSLINLIGLAIGMACCILILLYVQYELSYDLFHARANRIYRVTREERAPGRVVQMAAAPGPLATAMKQDLPEVEHIVRLKPPNTSWMLRYEDRGFYETSFYLSDPDVFEVFSIPLIHGDPKTALERPFTIVITEEVARRYFGDEDPIGKVIRGEETVDFEVTGIMSPLPQNSHLKFDILASMGTQERMNPYHLTEWRDAYKFYTYVLLPSDYDPAEVERKLPALVEKYAGDVFRTASVSMHFSLQPLTSIHLHSHLEGELSPNSDITSIYLFSAIAVFILLIACINFMNLSTARATVRAKEVGLRKVVGAHRGQLISQFLGESVLLSCFAAILAVVLVKLFLPTFNMITGTDIFFHLTTNRQALIGIAGITLMVGFISGSYPAFVLSAFQPVDVIAGAIKSGRSQGAFRKMLVTLQFTISIALLICSGIVSDQLDHLRNKPLGLNPDRTVIIPMTHTPMQEKYSVYKREILQHADVTGVASINFAPGRLNNLWFSIYQSIDAPNTEPQEMTTINVDADYLEVMDMELAAGRFLRETTNDTGYPPAYVLNESAVRRFGWASPQDAVGKQIAFLRAGDTDQQYTGAIVGVVKDFHIRSLHDPVEAMVLFEGTWGPYINVKVSGVDIPGTSRFLQDTWQKVQGQAPFEYHFMDDEITRLYTVEEQLGQVFGSFALIAIIVGCLGLFGLASFMATRRTREIGIRKVLGASIPSIIRLMSREFVSLVLAANIIAWPIAYYAMSRWLQNFAYRIDIGIGTFILAGILAFLITLVTVSGHAVRAARANPVDALRYE